MKYLTHYGKWLLLAVAIVTVISTVVFTPTGSRKIVTQFGEATGRVIGEGVSFKAPFIQDTETMNVRTVTVVFDNGQKNSDKTESSSMFAASKDLQDVQIAGIVNYHVPEGSVVNIFRQYGSQTTYENNIISPIIRETVKAVSAKYTAEELVTKREAFSDEVNKTLLTKFTNSDVIFERFSVTNFEFSKSYADAIEAKQVAQQQAAQAGYALEKSQKEAEAIKVQGDALKQNQDLVQWEAVKKWNGVLPTTTGGAVPFLNIK